MPTLQPIPFDAKCDMFYRPCAASIVYADLFIDSVNLTCQVQLLNVSVVLYSTYKNGVYIYI